MRIVAAAAAAAAVAAAGVGYYVDLVDYVAVVADGFEAGVVVGVDGAADERQPPLCAVGVVVDDELVDVGVAVADVHRWDK